MPGPPKVVTPEVKKLQKAEQSRRKRAESVRIGHCIAEWNHIKYMNNLQTDTEVAEMLISCYRNVETNQHLIRTSSCHTPRDQLSAGRENVQMSPSTTGDPLSIPPSAGKIYAQAVQPLIKSLENQLKKKTDDCFLMKQEYVDETMVMTTSSGNNTTGSITDNCEKNPENPVYINTSTGIDNPVEVKVEVDSDDNNENKSIDDERTNEINLDSGTMETSLPDVDDVDNELEDEFAKLKHMVDSSQDKVVPVVDENNGNEEFSVMKSSRIRSRGFRPNYAALDWTESSDSEGHGLNKDDVKKVKKGDDYVENDDDGGGGEEMEYSDGDYITSDEEFEVSDKKLKNVDKVKTESDSGCFDEGAENEPDTVESRKPRQAARKTAKYIAKREEITLKRLQEKKNWKSIKLEDHKEKFCAIDLESFERQHRANSRVVTKGYKCLVCQRFKCSDEKAIQNHLEEHINSVLDCPKCDFIAAYPMELQLHQKKEGHSKNGTFKYICELCGLSFAYHSGRNSHRGLVHDIPVHKCRVCPERFARHQTKYEHMRDAHPDQCQFCLTCKKCFLKSNFEEHAKICKPNAVCEMCGKVMNTLQLRRHMTRSHSGGARRHQCPLCEYSAKVSAALKRHMLSHNKLHPFHCDQCPFSCNQMVQLTSHMRTHSGEKPFKCALCNYAASWKVQLKDHDKVHQMVEAVMCNQCGILFKNERSLDIHTKKQH